MYPRCCRPATSWVHYTTSCNTQCSALEDGRDLRPKYAELIGIITKPLLLHLVGCLYYLYQCYTIKQISIIHGKFNLSLWPSHGDRMHNWSRVIAIKPEWEQHKHERVSRYCIADFLLPSGRQRPIQVCW